MVPKNVTWDFESRVATIRWEDGKVSRYRPQGMEAYVTRSGEETTLRVWSTNCCTCGSEFLVKTSAKATEDKTKFFRRACDEHKAKGLYGRS